MTGKLLEIPFITREMVQANRGTIFVFGDNIARWGLKGQAAAMRGEPNSLGIPTKRTPYIFMDNSDLQRVIPIVDAAFEILTAHLLKGGDVVWPKDGIGSGLAQLSTKAPAIDAYIKVSLERLKSVAISSAKRNPDDWERYIKLISLAKGSPIATANAADKEEQRKAAKIAEDLAVKLIDAGVPKPSNIASVDVTSFKDRFLSNFWPAQVEYDGVVYPSVENAFQAAKFLDLGERGAFRTITPEAAKKRGGRSGGLKSLRPDWNTARIEVMQQLLDRKFAPGSALAAKLLATGDGVLTEGNTWGDTFWGVDSKKGGENRLGKMLMARRAQLSASSRPRNSQRRAVRPETSSGARPASSRSAPEATPVSVVKKVISGGQTGADVGGLRAAKALGLQTGGWAATVGGVRWATQHKKEADIVSDPSLRTLYGMRLHPETGWVARTEQNVADSDGTLWFGKDSPGFDATRRACKSKGKKDFLVFWSTGHAPPDDAEFVAWLQKNNIQTLNVAGNREGSSPGIGEAVALFLTVALPKAVASERAAPQDDDGAAPLPPREKKRKVKVVDLPIFDWGYDLALAGKKTLTTRSPDASDAIGLDVGESGVARLIVGKGKKKDRKIVSIYIRRMGMYPTGSDLIAAAGGMAEYQRKEGGDTVQIPPEENIRQFRGWSLFELSRSPFRAEDAGGEETEESSYPSIPLPVSPDMMGLVESGDKGVEILKANVRPGHYVSDFRGTRVYVYAYYPFKGKSLIGDVEALAKNTIGTVARFVSDLGYTLVEKRLESAPVIRPNTQADSVRKEREEGKDFYYVNELVKKGVLGKRVELTDAVALNFLRAGVATPGVPVSAWDESATGFQAFAVSVHPLDRSQARGAERQKDATDLVLLESCADADRTDLYVLPITPRRLWAYLKTTILYLSDREEVAQTIAGSSSFLDAANTLRKKYRLDNYTDGAPDFADDSRVGWQTRDLIYLRLNRIPLKHGASWDELKTDQVPAGYGWTQNGAVRPLNFGIFGACFGAPGSNASLVSCFGSGVKRLGAQSLTQAYALWDASVHRGRAVPLPYIFRRSAIGEPYALVVSGKRDAWSTISPGESDETGNIRPKEWDNLSIYYAMLNVAKGAKDSPLSVCLLLPESDPDAEKDEISANAFKAFTLRMRVPEYQQSLFNDLKQMEGVGRYVTPERSHRSMLSRETLQESAADKAYREREVAKNTAQKQLRDRLPVFREELCSDSRYFGNHQLVLEWPAVYIGALTGNAFTPGWLRNEYSRQQVQQYITKQELQLEDFVAATQGETRSIEEAYGKLRGLQSVPSRYVPEDEAEEATEKIEPLNLGTIVAEEWAEITFIQDLVSDGKSIAEALDYAPLVPGRIILFRSGEPDVVTQKRTPIPVAGYLLVPQEAWKTHFLVRDRKVQVEAPVGENVKEPLPTVVATVSLFRESSAKIGAGKRAGEAMALLKKYTEKLPGFEFDPWYLGVPAAWVNMTPVSDPPKPPELRFYPYYCGIGNIRNVAQNFLRVKVTSKTDGSYGLQPYSTTWSTPTQPYLLDRLLYADAEEKLLAKKENRAPIARAIAPIGSPAFRDEIAAAFKDSRTPDVVVTGKAAVWVGMASSGGTARGGHRPVDASLAVKTAYRQRGLYQLVNKSLQLRSEKPYRDVGPDDRGWSFRQFQDGSVLILAPEEEKRARPEKPGSPIAVYVAKRWGKYVLPGAEVSSRGGVGSLHAILRSNWMDILRFMNIFRKSEGHAELPADPNAPDFTTCPIDEESPDEASVRLEIEALNVLRDWSSGKLAKDLIRVYWRNVLAGINARRAASAEAPLSSDYPCPIWTMSEKMEEDRITKEALAVLQGLPANAAPAKGKELRFIRDNWDAIRSRINAERATRKGTTQIPEFVPCPIRSASEATEDERVEREALAVFGATELGKTAYGYSLLASRDAMRPWNDDAEKRYLPQDYSDNIHPRTVDAIRAIENGQRSRRLRWRDRNTAVQNPITQDEYRALEAWARKPHKGKKGEKSTEAEIAERVFAENREQPLDPYRSDTSYAEGVRAFFPQRSFRSPTPSMKTLTPASRFSVLRDHDVVTRFDDPELPTKEADERLKSRIVERKEALGDEDIRKYVGDAAQMSATGALRLHQDRHRSKVEGHVVSPSGALCRRYRNSSRLKDYTPPAAVTQALTCWIIVAPPEGGHAARVMSFRNGAHIDCDMEVRASRQLPAHIAKSIEGMILWLAEKEMRMLRIASINIAQVGSTVYRVLWSRGMSTSLDVKTLLEEAYRGEAKKTPWSAEKDLANYMRAAKAAVSAPYAASFRSQNEKESTSQPHAEDVEAESSNIPFEGEIGE